jgi:hypothetical protein
MRLVEFQGDASRTPVAVAKALLSAIPAKRLGGPSRVYDLGGDHRAVVYAFNNSLGGFAIAWSKTMPEIGVDRLYVWDEMNIYSDPTAELLLPSGVPFTEMLQDVVAWLKKPVIGKIEVGGKLGEDQELDEMATRTTAQDFIQMAIGKYGDGAANLTLPQLMDVAKENDVQIPGDIRSNPQYKTGPHTWNLLGKERGEASTNRELGKAMGGDVEDAQSNVPPEFQDTLQLAKAKSVNRLAGQGKLYLMGRKTNGAFFRVPGLEEYTAQLERLLARQLADNGASGRQTMEEQYEQLIDKVKLVAGGESNFIKSLLITGAPSSGKTFVVMKAIKELGLQPGKDYVVKKGGITTVAMYRTLIEQVDGMVIFDDCDSVVDDEKAVNMLKGALDTDPVREISYDKKGAYNTAVMDPEHRRDVVDKMSRILRGKPIEGDLEYFESRLNYKDDEFDDIEIPDEEEEDEGGQQKYYFSQNQLHKTQQWIESHLPNKIDFRGRIIFISNMLEDEWDGAIITRAFSENMEFTSGEMLDYIEKIKAHIKTPNLTEEQKQEVMDYLRELYTTGKIKRQINFRLVQQCFDLRLTNNWKKMMAML